MREFDATEAVTFDLAFGHIHLDGAPTRVMVPADALLALCAAAGEEEASALAHAIGEAMGRRVAVRLSDGAEDRHDAVRKCSFEEVINHLAGELAVIGFGSLGAERWGKALVVRVDQSPLGDDGDAFMGELIQAAFKALAGAAVRVVRLHRDGVRTRLLVVSGAAVDAIRKRVQDGDDWGAVLAALHREGASA